MRRSLLACALAVAGLMIVSANSPLVAKEAKEAGKAKSMEKPMASKMGMATYLVMIRHTPEECLNALDAAAAAGNEDLSKWEWGCKSGDHTGYRMVHAASQDEAMKVVPESERAKAKVIKLDKFTAAEIKAIHEKMKS